MKKIPHFIGIDISSDDFTVSIFIHPELPIKTRGPFLNSSEGFEAFQQWLRSHHVNARNSILCLEATGVYGEQLCYWLKAQGFKVAIEPPLKVKRSFDTKGHKTDTIDSRQIAEYAFRFHDELKFWQPRHEIIEQIKVLLSTREQFVHQKTADMNSLNALRRKVVQTPLANQFYQTNIQNLSNQIKVIEQEIQKLIDQDPDFKNTVSLLRTIPGVAMLLAANLLVVTHGFTQELYYKRLAAYIGICPYKHESGKYVYKKPRSARYGPARLRKLLRLAAWSLKTHKKPYQCYFLQKSAQGKESAVILNNISNKLLKIMCAIINNQKPYQENYKSVNPLILS